MRCFVFCLLLALMTSHLRSQSCANTTPTWKSDITAACGQMVMTMIHDAGGRPYLYVANKEAGLRIYDISDLSNPVLKRSLVPLLFDTLDVMSLCQQGNYVYLALGNHFSKTQKSGMAIVKVDTPTNAWVTAHWSMAGSAGGAGIVATEGNYAYLGAMGNGLAILDISDKHNIVYKSKIIPDINYPTSGPNPDLYNARGMAVKNDMVYLCYDAGGIRIINVADKVNPKESGRFSNPLLNGQPRAYNNCVLDDTLLYVAVDYCGLEIINIRDTAKMEIVGKWNPYNCPSNNWFNTPVHANEIKLDKNCKTLFISTGKSDMMVVNVADPSKPDSCNMYGGVNNNIGTWGVEIFGNKIFLSYICAIIPFSSNWTGIKTLTYKGCAGNIHFQDPDPIVLVFPNPASGKLQVILPGEGFYDRTNVIGIYDAQGKTVGRYTAQIAGNSFSLDITTLPPGVYLLNVQLHGKILWRQFAIE